MAGKKGMRLRSFGTLRRLRSGRWQASYIGDDFQRHNAPYTFTNKGDGEAWLNAERLLLERAEWTAPSIRTERQRAKSKTLGEYTTDWLATRKLSPRTMIEYQAKYTNLIAPTLGKVPLSSLSPEIIRRWYAGLDAAYERRNSHAYGLLHAVLNTAVSDGLMASNPARITGAMNPKRKKEPTILTPDEMAALADAITPQFRAYVLLSAWCAMRLGEAIELRRGDIGAGCADVTIARAVTRTPGTKIVKTTKTDEVRTVPIPPHIRACVKHHLDCYTGKGADALLFPAPNGGHINYTSLRRGHFDKALKAIGKPTVTPHALRHFGVTMVARVSGNLRDTMDFTGHKSVSTSLLYQHSSPGRKAEIADQLSAQAEMAD